MFVYKYSTLFRRNNLHPLSSFSFGPNLRSLFVVVCNQAYDPQTMYDIPYFRSAVNETVRGHGLQFPQEVIF